MRPFSQSALLAVFVLLQCSLSTAATVTDTGTCMSTVHNITDEQIKQYRRDGQCSLSLALALAARARALSL